MVFEVKIKLQEKYELIFIFNCCNIQCQYIKNNINNEFIK